MSLLAAVIRSLLLPIAPAAELVPEPFATAPVAEAVQQPQRRAPAIESLESLDVIYESILHKSQLASAASPALADLIDIIHRDESVQRAAGTCAAKHQRLIELAGFRSEIHAAIHVAIAQDDCSDTAGLTPAVVAEALRQRAVEIEEAIDDCREDHASHRAASATRMQKHEPLRSAVSTRLDQFIAERASLLQADDADRRANRIGLTGSSRYAELRKAGLTDFQIVEILPGAAAPETVAARRNERIAELAGQIEKLNAFTSSAIFDPTAIIGIDPAIDAAIVARDGALPAKVA